MKITPALLKINAFNLHCEGCVCGLCQRGAAAIEQAVKETAEECATKAKWWQGEAIGPFESCSCGAGISKSIREDFGIVVQSPANGEASNTGAQWESGGESVTKRERDDAVLSGVLIALGIVYTNEPDPTATLTQDIVGTVGEITAQRIGERPWQTNWILTSWTGALEER